MHEVILNSKGLSDQFQSRNEALDALDEIAAGLLILRARKQIEGLLWMKDQPCNTIVYHGTSLLELFRSYLGRSKDRGNFMLNLATRCSIDDGVIEEEANLEDFLDQEIEGFPKSIDLLWCAISCTKIAVSLSPNDRWHHNPLSLRLVHDGNQPKTVDVKNIFSLQSAQEISEHLNSLELEGISPVKLWGRRAFLFPNLCFGQDVEKQLQSIGTDLFRSAIGRLEELDKAASDWDSACKPSPTYLSKVTGESAATMQRYGKERVFRSSSGQPETYEKHAHLHSGARIHLREIPERSKIEVGYIGKHLKIVSTR